MLMALEQQLGGLENAHSSTWKMLSPALDEKSNTFTSTYIELKSIYSVDYKYSFDYSIKKLPNIRTKNSPVHIP